MHIKLANLTVEKPTSKLNINTLQLYWPALGNLDVMSHFQVSALTRPVSKEGTYQRQRVGRDKMERLREEREMAREYKLGKGRAKESQQ